MECCLNAGCRGRSECVRAEDRGCMIIVLGHHDGQYINKKQKKHYAIFDVNFDKNNNIQQ